MYRIYIVVFIFIISFSSFGQVKNPQKSRYGFDVNSKPSIYYNSFIVYNEGPKLVFSLDIQNDILQFKKEGEFYKAKYEIALNLKDLDEKETLFSESWFENVQLSDFLETNSKLEYQNSRRNFNLKQGSGKYKLLIELRDAQTGNNYYSKRIIEILDQSKSGIKHGDIVFVDHKNITHNNILISSQKDVVELNNSPLVMFEYHSESTDTLKILSQLYRVDENEKKEDVYTNLFSIIPDIGFNYFVENIDDSLLFEGKYILKYNLSLSNNKSVLQDTFQVVWFGKPTYLYKYDLALRPMKYLLTEQEYEYANDLSMKELKKWFNDYWRKKDNTPGTPFNEVQNEFYIRVQKSIQEFSLRFKEGWRTERGETLILYGEPDRVDKHHHIAGSEPYEIWFYENLNKKITFIDKKDNGDFKLVNIENIEE